MALVGSKSEKRRAKTVVKYLCGVPPEFCCGGNANCSNGLKQRKTHSDQKDAFKCMSKYLVSQGYEKIGTRDFAAPNDGPVRIISKVSHFGYRLRPGKGGRHMAERGGCIIG